MGLLGRIAGRLFNTGAENAGAKNLVSKRKILGRLALMLLIPNVFLAAYFYKKTKNELNEQRALQAQMQAQLAEDYKKSPEQVEEEAAEDVKADMGFEKSATEQPVNEEPAVAA